MNSKKNKMIFDIAIIGAGPVGIAFACSFAKTNMKIAIIEKQPKKILENPKIDGREIALTHRSANILKESECLAKYTCQVNNNNQRSKGSKW